MLLRQLFCIVRIFPSCPPTKGKKCQEKMLKQIQWQFFEIIPNSRFSLTKDKCKNTWTTTFRPYSFSEDYVRKCSFLTTLNLVKEKNKEKLMAHACEEHFPCAPGCPNAKSREMFLVVWKEKEMLEARTLTQCTIPSKKSAAWKQAHSWHCGLHW